LNGTLEKPFSSGPESGQLPALNALQLNPDKRQQGLLSAGLF
jgi:hypothetical protein